MISRPRFDRYVTAEEREEFLTALISQATLIDVNVRIDLCRDPADDRILELAVSGGAAFLVTGDSDLLCLKECQGVRIVSPADFLRARES